MIVFGVRGREELVQLRDRVHHRHRDAVGAAEPAALTFHPALLMGALAVGLQPVPASQHLRHRSLQIVVADMAERHPARLLERIYVTLQERLLAPGCRTPGAPTGPTRTAGT
jgi:hypothetical protein